MTHPGPTHPPTPSVPDLALPSTQPQPSNPTPLPPITPQRWHARLAAQRGYRWWFPFAYAAIPAVGLTAFAAIWPPAAAPLITSPVASIVAIWVLASAVSTAAEWPARRDARRAARPTKTRTLPPLLNTGGTAPRIRIRRQSRATHSPVGAPGGTRRSSPPVPIRAG